MLYISECSGYPYSNFDHPALWQVKNSDLAAAEVNRQPENQGIVPNVKRSRRERSNSMIQGKIITITGGKFNNIGGDYHEHNTYAIEESATRPKYLKQILGQYYFIKFHISMILMVLYRHDQET